MGLDCSVCENCLRASCVVYGHDVEKSVRACEQSGHRYFHAKGGIKYQCVKPFRVRIHRDDIPTDNYLYIEKGSIWSIREVSSDFEGNIELVCEGTQEQMVITWGTLGIFFKRMEV